MLSYLTTSVNLVYAHPGRLFVYINTGVHGGPSVHHHVYVAIYDRMKRLVKHYKTRRCDSFVSRQERNSGPQQT